ncbi:MAG: hypothetical protein OIF50_01450 [Flavobacteriaceae bacterium]|nr:hypothetical protein [Flavobacteriaceae bacterium]
MTNLNFLAAFILGLFAMQAQSHTTYNVNTNGVGFTSDMMRVENKMNDEFKQRYLLPDWNKEARIRMNDKMVKVNAVNYNMYQDRFEVRFHADSIMVFDRDVRMVQLDNKKFELIRLPERSRYCQILADGENYSLLKTYQYVEREATPNPKMITNIKKVKSIVKKYYIKDKRNKKIVMVKLRKKDMMSIFKSDGRSVKDFMKSKKLSYRKEAHITQLCHFFNNM